MRSPAEELRSFIAARVPLTVADWEAIQAVFEPLTVRHKGLYLQSGRTCDRVACLAHGCLAASNTHAQADVTTHIFLEGSFVADYYSYLTCTHHCRTSARSRTVRCWSLSVAPPRSCTSRCRCGSDWAEGSPRTCISAPASARHRSCTTPPSCATRSWWRTLTFNVPVNLATGRWDPDHPRRLEANAQPLGVLPGRALVAAPGRLCHGLRGGQQMSHLIVFGATGALGREIVVYALERGHHVTAVARTPSAMPEPQHGLAVVQGDVLVPPTCWQRWPSTGSRGSSRCRHGESGTA